MKTRFPEYKLIFICEEKSLYPLILKKIAEIQYEKFVNGDKRRKITKLILDHATDMKLVKQEIKKGCYGYHLVGKFQFDSEMMEKQFFMLKVYWCLLIFQI